MAITYGFIFGAASVGLMLIVLIIGLAAGFARQTGKGVCSLVGIIGGIVACSVVMSLLLKNKEGAYTGFYANLMQKTSALFANQLKGFTDAVSGMAVITDAAGKSVYAAGDVAKLFGEWLLNGAAYVILWLAGYLIVKYLLWGINLLLRQLSKVPVFKTIDRIFGAIWSLGITYLIVFGLIYTALAVVCLKMGKEGSVFEQIITVLKKGTTQSAVFKFLTNYNFVGTWLAKMFNVDLLALAVIA